MSEKLVLRAVTSVSGVRLSGTESEEKEMRGLFKEIYDDAEKRGEKRGIVKGIIELSQDYHLSEEAVIQQIEKG